MVEVFYEQLNFEMLTESQAYGVSLFSSNNTEIRTTKKSRNEWPVY